MTEPIEVFIEENTVPNFDQLWINDGQAASQIDNYYDLCDAMFIAEHGLDQWEEENGRLPDERRIPVAELLSDIDDPDLAADIHNLTTA